jgi:hypothetical protein
MVNQPQGDGNTIFVVHGTGWAPGQRVTVRLDGRQASRNGPTVDRKGSFNYAINQERDFYPGPLPLGSHRVLVTATGSPRAEVTFLVVP